MPTREEIVESYNTGTVKSLIYETGFSTVTMRKGNQSGVRVKGVRKPLLKITLGKSFFEQGSPIYYSRGFSGHNHLIVHSRPLHQRKDGCPIWACRVLLVKRNSGLKTIKPVVKATIHDGFICDTSAIFSHRPFTNTLWSWTERGIRTQERRKVVDEVKKVLT